MLTIADKISHGRYLTFYLLVSYYTNRSKTYYLKEQVTVPLRELMDSIACFDRPFLRRRGSVGSSKVMAFE